MDAELQIKQGAELYGLQPVMHQVISTSELLFDTVQLPLVITSGTETVPARSANSMHIRGCALDLRAKHLPQDKRAGFHRLLRSQLPGYTVLHEDKDTPNEHYHVHKLCKWVLQ